ncbi:MAG TPA: diguanylate cyclase [Galbitalea sp.]|jgi:diguanylate cyclase (GGDEF)-like protein
MDQVPGDALPSGLVEVDAAGAIVDVNGLVLEWSGVGRDDLIGHPLEHLLRQPASTGLDSLEYLPAIAEITRPDGAILPVLVAETPADSGRNGYLTLFDAREQRSYKEQLQSRHSLVERTQTRLQLVIASSISFAEARDEEELAEVLADTAARAYAAEEAVVFLLDDDLVFRQMAGTNPFHDLPDIGSLAGQALALRDVLKVVGREGADAISASVGRAFEATGVQAMIIAPIHQGDQPLGIVAAFFHHPRTFDEQASPLADALAGQASRAVTALRLQRRLAHAALHDDTTGLPNRRFLEEATDVLSSRSFGELAAVLFVDLDGFKAVNDALGHHLGDELLKIVGQRLQSSIREGDVVARYGGDEFVIVSAVTAESDATDLAARIQETISAPYTILPPDLRIGASIGIATGSIGSLPLATDRLVRAADQAMYEAKNAGGNRIVAANS